MHVPRCTSCHPSMASASRHLSTTIRFINTRQPPSLDFPSFSYLDSLRDLICPRCLRLRDLTPNPPQSGGFVSRNLSLSLSAHASTSLSAASTKAAFATTAMPLSRAFDLVTFHQVYGADQPCAHNYLSPRSRRDHVVTVTGLHGHTAGDGHVRMALYASGPSGIVLCRRNLPRTHLAPAQLSIETAHVPLRHAVRTLRGQPRDMPLHLGPP